MGGERRLRRLRVGSRHGRDVAHEPVGRLPVAAVAHGHRRFAPLPFFLVTLPAGAIADLANRRNLFIAVYLWLAAAAGLLALCTALRLVHPYVILTTVFLLGVGFALNAPVWASLVPEIARKEELASAITLSGVQMNLAGIVGPALGGLLLPMMGPAVLFSLNALAFLGAAGMIAQVYHPPRRSEPNLEHF